MNYAPYLALIGVLILLIVASGVFVRLASIGGYVVLSVSNVNYQSNDPYVGGNAWLITLVQNGQGQYISGTISKSQLEDKDDNVRAKNDVAVKMELREMYASYPIQSQTDRLRHVDWVKTNIVTACPSGFPNYMDFTWDRYCWKYTDSAAYGRILTPTTNFRTDITLTSGYKTETATIGNLEGVTDISIGQAGQMSWVGSLSSGELPPISSDQGISAMYVYAKGGWITIDESRWQDWRRYALSTELGYCLQNNYDKEACFVRYNSLESSVLSGKSLEASGGTKATTSGTQDNGKVRLELTKAIQFPVMTLRLKSDWVETVYITVPVGIPKITDISSTEFKTGSTGFITATIQNVGTADGSFAVSTSCGGSFSVQGTTSLLGILKPNEETTIYIPLSANVLSKSSDTCTVSAYDRNNPNNKDTRQVTVTANPIILCTAGEKRINGNTIEQCVPEGSGWKTIEICGVDEEPKRTNNDISCVKKSSGDGDEGWSFDLSWLTSFLKSPQFLLGLIAVVIIIAVVAFLLSGGAGLIGAGLVARRAMKK